MAAVAALYERRNQLTYLRSALIERRYSKLTRCRVYLTIVRMMSIVFLNLDGPSVSTQFRLPSRVQAENLTKSGYVFLEKQTSFFASFIRWFDASAATPPIENGSRHQVDWVRTAPFIAVHLMCLGVIWVGWSWVAVGVAALLYAIRMFAVTGIYHRYFSHRTFKTSRPMQLALALLANSATQRGPLWWAAHHRQHHLYSDTENDVHSPRIHGFIWSHVGWITDHRNFPTKLDAVRDLAKFPELRFLDRFDTLVPFLTGASLYFLGAALSHFAPGLHTSGMQMLIWGFFVSTVVLFHATCTINSLAHQMGRRRFDTGDDSRNSLLLALLTFGEGWHNNHHHFPSTVHQGFYWWEIDITYYLLRALSWTGLIWDLKPVPAKVKDLNRYADEAAA